LKVEEKTNKHCGIVRVEIVICLFLYLLKFMEIKGKRTWGELAINIGKVDCVSAVDERQQRS